MQCTVEENHGLDRLDRSKRTTRGVMNAEERETMVAKLAASRGGQEKSVMEYYGPAAIDNLYDKSVAGHYFGPSKCAEAISCYHPDSHNITILDVGAGTGLVGEELRKLGFKTVDALDPLHAFLEIAEKKGVYRTFFNEYFTENNEYLPIDGYDVLVACGAFSRGHMKCAVLPEMVRCTKPGGIVVISIREEFLFSIEEYKDRLEPEMKRLEEEGKWQMLERTVIPRYVYGKAGVLFVFRVK